MEPRLVKKMEDCLTISNEFTSCFWIFNIVWVLSLCEYSHFVFGFCYSAKTSILIIRIKLNFYILYIIIWLSLFIVMITWDQVMLVQLAAQFFVLVALKLFSIY